MGATSWFQSPSYLDDEFCSSTGAPGARPGKLWCPPTQLSPRCFLKLSSLFASKTFLSPVTYLAFICEFPSILKTVFLLCVHLEQVHVYVHFRASSLGDLILFFHPQFYDILMSRKYIHSIKGKYFLSVSELVIITASTTFAFISLSFFLFLEIL